MSSGSFFQRPAVLLALGLCAVAAVVSIIGRIAGGSRSQQKTIALVSPRGAEGYPTFSPDGKRLAYSVRTGKDEGFRLFVRDLPYGQRWQMTSGPGSDIAPSWSPDGGSVAFLRVDDEAAACMIVPAEGGNGRKLADCGAVFQADQFLPAAAWTPDSKSLVISLAAEKQLPAMALIAAAGGAPKRLTSPPPGTLGDNTPAVSPDGKTLAFVRNAETDGGDIFVCNLADCAPRQITFENHPIRGLAWTPDGRSLVFASHRSETWRLYRLPAGGGDPRDLGVTGKREQFPAVSRAGDRLAFTESPSVSAIWRAPLHSKDAAEGAPLIRSTGREWAPSYSPDGKKIACLSDQSGTDEIWVSDVEGRSRAQVTHLAGQIRPGRPRWSPDGRLLLFEAYGRGAPEIDIVLAAGGSPQRVLAEANGPSWAHDGKSIYYQSRGQIWKATADGGKPRQLTRQFGGMQPEESPDGKVVYFQRWGTVWQVPAEGGKEEEVLQGGIWGTMQPSGKGFYFAEFRRGPQRRQAVSFYDIAARQSTVVFQGGDPSAFSVSPDGKSILYPRVDRSDTTLMLVEGFR